MTTPPKATVLWRYMDFAKFIEMLESRTLWFVRVDQLEDPLEGLHTDAELAGIRKNLERKRSQQLISVFRRARRELYVNCWRAGTEESLAMWDLYGRGAGIVAIKSTVGRIQEAVAKYDKPVFISKTRYIDWNDAPGLDNVLVACSRKDQSYQHESEVRVILLGEFFKSTNRRLGIRLSIDPEQLVTEVVVGPREQEWVLRLVKQVMKRYGLVQSVIASDRLMRRR